MEEARLQRLVEAQRAFFMSGETLDVDERVLLLEKLRAAVSACEGAIVDALRADLGKCGQESYLSEIGLVLNELTYMITHARRLSKSRRIHTPLALLPARSRATRSPYGTVLALSPWSFPFLMSMLPLIDAVAAGNTVLIKPSDEAPSTAAMAQMLVEQVFPPEWAAVVTGGEEIDRILIRQRFDFIFCGGSSAKGRAVLRAAAESLTPVALALDGKSPCVIDRTANIEMAARRIVFGKLLNCGQSRIAPDYVLVEDRVRDRFMRAVQDEIVLQYGEHPLENPDYGKLVNDRHFYRVQSLIDPARLVFGGMCDPGTLRIEPTVLAGVQWSDAVMQQEVYGPVLPIMSFHGVDEAARMVNDGPCPPALYLFTADGVAEKYVMTHCHFGSGCVNDTLLQAASPVLPCGGMGGCRGREGFMTFTREKGVVKRRSWPDVPARYQPYGKRAEQAARVLMH